MARRKRLGVPSAEELRDLEAGFAAKPVQMTPPPIAQIAGDAATFSQPLDAEERAKAAQDATDAARLAEAEAAGRLIVELPVAAIKAEEVTRDRAALDPEEMEELKRSIAANGLRMPIEVFPLIPPLDGAEYGLLSGFRRLRAVRELSGQGASIRALIRHPLDLGDAFVAMVEENEVRADLSHYERGRIAVIAAAQGAFPDLATAVDALFATGSRAKRSKIRSFALIHEELGDLILFPQALGERAGLRLAQALRAGFADRLRQALMQTPSDGPEAEWATLDPIVLEAEQTGPASARRGRPKRIRAARAAQNRVELANGIAISQEKDGDTYLIRFHGKNVDRDLVETVMTSIRFLLEPK